MAPPLPSKTVAECTPPQLGQSQPAVLPTTAFVQQFTKPNLQSQMPPYMVNHFESTIDLFVIESFS